MIDNDTTGPPHPLTAAVRGLVDAVDALRREFAAAQRAAWAGHGAEHLAAANAALRAIAGAAPGTEAMPLEGAAAVAVEVLRGRLVAAGREFAEAAEMIGNAASESHRRGLSDPRRPVIFRSDFGHGQIVGWHAAQGPHMPLSVSDPDAVLVGFVGALPPGHAARTVCADDEVVRLGGSTRDAWLVLGKVDPRRPWWDLGPVRALTIQWRRQLDSEAAGAEAVRRQVAERDEKVRRARIAELEGLLAGTGGAR